MSETAWRPMAAADASEPAEGSATDRRRVALFGGLALAALAGTGVLLLSGPDETVLDELAAPVAAVPSATATARAAPALPDAPAPADARTGRNPFVDPAPPPPAAAVVAAPVGDGALTGPAPDGPDPAAPIAPPVVEAVPGATSPSTDVAVGAESLTLLRVEGSGDARKAAFRLGAEQVTAGVGDSFGGAAGLLLLSLQEGPEPGQWTAVVQAGLGDPFDVGTGTPVPLP